MTQTPTLGSVQSLIKHFIGKTESLKEDSQTGFIPLLCRNINNRSPLLIADIHIGPGTYQHRQKLYISIENSAENRR